MTGKKKADEGLDIFQKFNLIEKIANLLNKYGYKNIVSSLIIFILFTGTIIIFLNQRSIVENILLEQKAKEKSSEINNIRFRVNEVNPRVDGILYKLLTETRADRAFVIEMHNGTDNPTGMPFVFGHMTHEKMMCDTMMSVVDQYERVNLSSLTFPNYILRNKMFIGSIEDLKRIDTKLYHKMTNNGVKFIGMYSLRTMDVEIGIIGITFNTEMDYNKRVIEASLIDASQRLSILLDITKNVEGT